MTAKAITQYGIIATVVLWIGWDVYVAFFNNEPGDTISRVVLEWSQAWPIIPLAVGVVAGHLWWPQRVSE